MDVAPIPTARKTRFAALFAEHPEVGAMFLLEGEVTDEQARQTAAEQPIRNGQPEDRLRISNYFMACRPGHPIMDDILRLAVLRSGLPVQGDYDILYTTGPDLVSTVVNRHAYTDVVIVRETEEKLGFQHLVSGGWRDQALVWRHPGWDLWLESGRLGGWRPPGV